MSTPPTVSPLPKRLAPSFARSVTASSSTSHVSFSPSKSGTLSIPAERPVSSASTSTSHLRSGSLSGSRPSSIIEVVDCAEDAVGFLPSSPTRSKGKARDTGLGVEGEMTATGDARQGLRALAKLGSSSGSRSRATSLIGELCVFVARLTTGDVNTLPPSTTEALSSSGKAFPPRRYFVLTNAGKPVFTSYVDTIRITAANKSQARGGGGRRRHLDQPHGRRASSNVYLRRRRFGPSEASRLKAPLMADRTRLGGITLSFW